MNKRKIEVEIEEGDIIITNDKTWEVFDIGWGGTLSLDPKIGEWRTFEKEELEEVIQHSGRFKLIRSDYIDMFG